LRARAKSRPPRRALETMAVQAVIATHWKRFSAIRTDNGSLFT
jgi:hypothetical protein